MQSCLAEVRARMNVHAPPDREVNRNNQLFAAGCRTLGIRTRTFELNMQGCVGCGFCSAGCAYDAKRGALVTWMPDALARGVTLVHHADVKRLEYHGGRATGVVADVAPTRPGSRPNSMKPGALRVRAKLVVVAAGAVETPSLLQRSGHPDPYDRLGRGLVLHPSLPMVGLSVTEVAGHRGIEGSMYSDHFAESDGFYYECLFGHPLYGAAVLPGFGTDHFELMLAFRRLFGFGAMLIDESADDNRVSWDGLKERTRIDYRLTEADAHRFRKAAIHGVQILFAAGAREAWLTGEGRSCKARRWSWRASNASPSNRVYLLCDRMDGSATLASLHEDCSNRLVVACSPSPPAPHGASDSRYSSDRGVHPRPAR